MNKYQKTAIVEILGMILLSVAVGFTMSAIAQYFTVAQVIIGLGMIAMGYCFYIIYKLRVDQLQTRDEILKNLK
jgi:cytochrome c biogenesis protein CcdA